MSLKKVFRLFLVCLTCLFFLSGCGHTTGFSSTEAIGYMTKSRDFLAFCLMVLNQPDEVSKAFYNQVISRYYYSMLFLAKVATKDSKSVNHGDGGSHMRVWQQSRKKSYSVYGDGLRSLRVKSDYEYRSVNDSIKDVESFKTIVTDDKAFKDLMTDVEGVYEDWSNRSEVIDRCDVLKEQIINNREEIIKNL